jgi:hypothetical protein
VEVGDFGGFDGVAVEVFGFLGGGVQKRGVDIFGVNVIE